MHNSLLYTNKNTNDLQQNQLREPYTSKFSTSNCSTYTLQSTYFEGEANFTSLNVVLYGHSVQVFIYIKHGTSIC
jgi:hypothetical protein